MMQAVVIALVVVVILIIAWLVYLTTRCGCKPRHDGADQTPAPTGGADDWTAREVIAWEQTSIALTRMANAMQPARLMAPPRPDVPEDFS